MIKAIKQELLPPSKGSERRAARRGAASAAEGSQPPHEVSLRVFFWGGEPAPVVFRAHGSVPISPPEAVCNRGALGRRWGWGHGEGRWRRPPHGAEGRSCQARLGWRVPCGSTSCQAHKKNNKPCDFLHNCTSRVPLLTALCFFIPPEARYYSPAATARYT